MSVLHDPKNARVLLEHRRTGKVHAAHAVKVEHRGCRHEGANSQIVYFLECGGSRERDEIRFGDELRDATVVTCLRCRRALRDYADEVSGTARKWTNLVHELERMLRGAE